MVLNRFLKITVTALQVQLAPLIGFGFCLVVSYFYLFVNDSRYPKENPLVLWFGFLTSALCLVASITIGKIYLKDKTQVKSLRDGVFAVIFAWIIACTISALVFVLAGFPDPNKVGGYSFFRMFADGFFESMSGYTTTGSSILSSVEVFPRGLLMWRTVMHMIGGMGIAFLALTLIKKAFQGREEVINAEAETHIILGYKDEQEARDSGFDFIKIYLLLTLILISLLTISSLFFRAAPQEKIYDNLYDSVYYAFSTMGTGGFAPYDTSAGLTTVKDGREFIGGLQNPVSEWIIAFFMFLAGANFALWFDLAFKRNWKILFKSLELKVYTAIVAFLTFGIGISLYFFSNGNYSLEQSFRYAFFNVTTVISTTGLGNVDFTLWPALAQGLLFVCYLVGGMVGSTAGGPKVARFIVGFKYISMELKNLLSGSNRDRFKVDGVVYNRHNSALIISHIVLYFMIFFAGLIGIMATSPTITLADNTTKNVDFISAMTASLANLGNIGPAVAVGSVNAGPAGNYYAYSETAKMIMILLMFIGRVGVISLLLVFVSAKGEQRISLVEEHFDSDLPTLIR